MRHNQTATGYDALHRLTIEAFDGASQTQQQLAADLGRSQASISKALNTPGSKYASLQREIIAHLTPYEVEESITFRLVKREAVGVES